MTDQEIYVNSKELYQDILKLEEQGKKNILISSPVETGKTNFLFEYLVKQKPKSKIAIFSNRALLKEQTRDKIYRNQFMKISNIQIPSYCYQIIDKALDDSKSAKEKALVFIEELNTKDKNRMLDEEEEETIIEAFEKTERFIREEIQDLDYLILDEAHYFTTDSTFNNKTAEHFSYIFNKNKVTKLYLTATPETLIEAIREFEVLNDVEENQKIVILKPLPQDITVELEYAGKDESPILNYWQTDILEHTASSYTFEFIHERNKEKRLEQELSKSNPKDKLIYFTNNKMKGFHLFGKAEGRKMIDKSLKGGLFICSRYDSNGFNEFINDRERENIIKNERFNADVLVTTKALDNGVNIKDANVKRIFIEEVSYDEAIQMLGRIRTKDRRTNNPIHVMIAVPDYSSIQNNITSLKRNRSLTDNIFKRAQLTAQIQAYEDLKEFRIGVYKKLTFSYFECLYSYFTQSDEQLEISEVYGIEELYQEFEKDKAEIERIKQEKQKRKIKEEKKLKTRVIERTFSKYGNRELLKGEFDMLAKELNFKSKDSKLLKTATKINEQLIEFGYKITSKRKMIDGERNTIYKLEMR